MIRKSLFVAQRHTLTLPLRAQACPDTSRMYGRAYGWQRQSWHLNPGPFAAPNRPTDYNPGSFQKRLQHAMTAAGNASEAYGEGDDEGDRVCHAAQRPQGGGGGGSGGGDHPDLEGLQFVDMNGRPIDGQDCDIVYDDAALAPSTRTVVDEDGGVVSVYVVAPDADDDYAWAVAATGAPESPVTVAAPPATAVETPAQPGSGEAPLAGPVRTAVARRRLKTVVTVAPVAY